MLDFMRHLWKQTPEYATLLTEPSSEPESAPQDSAPPVPFSEADDEPTEECCPPTARSFLSPDAAYELAQAAIADGDYVAGKAWMQYCNQQSRR